MGLPSSMLTCCLAVGSSEFWTKWYICWSKGVSERRTMSGVWNASTGARASKKKVSIRDENLATPGPVTITCVFVLLTL